MTVDYQTLHAGGKAGSVEWYTPKNLVDSLGVFDLDPCAPINRLWDTAKTHYNKLDDGLSKDWFGRVWLNPPYDSLAAWIQRLSDHGNGIALVFNRTETVYFKEHIWESATAVLFLYDRIHFFRLNGISSRSGAGSVLIAYGDQNADALMNSGISGKFIRLKVEPPTEDAK